MNYNNILLIEDDEADQQIFSMVLQSIGPHLRCTVEEDAMRTLYQLMNAEMLADLIFLDVDLPGMTGIEFLRELKRNEQLKRIPVVVMSGVPNSDDERTIKELGALDYIVKPSKFSELKRILSTIIEFSPS